MRRIRLGVCIVGIALLLAGCSGGSFATPVARPTGSPGTPTTRSGGEVPSAPTTGSGVGVPGGTSEGVAFTGADKWQAAGITGKGIKVGVIDGNFLHYKEFLGNARVTTRSFRSDGLVDDPSDPSEIHGTACAEIVHEMAPDTELYLAAIETSNEFVLAIRWLVNTAGVSVISTSLGYDLQYPLDDSSSLAQEIGKAKAAGVFFAISAGNEASGKIGSASGAAHFGATFQDKDGDGFHDFPGAQTPNALRVRIDDRPFHVRLNWDDWKQPHVNYDLFLYDMAGQEVGRSDNDQSRGTKPPYEAIQGKTQPGTYLIKVKKVNRSDPDLPFNLHIQRAQLEQITPAQSLSAPADAKGAFTVAAVDVQTGKVEDFSSQGTTMDGRKKPDLSGPDNARSLAYASVGKKTFTGTSAATPHVAGAAALYKQAFPDASPDAIFRFFTDHAKPPQGALKGDNITGVGLLFLDTPPPGASTSPVPSRPAASVAASPAPSLPAASPVPSRPAASTAASPAPILPAASSVPSRPAASAAPSRPAASATATGNLVTAGTPFTDTFSSPASGLPAAGYQNGEYHIRANAGTTAVATYPRAVRNAASETYAVQVRKISGADDAPMGLTVRQSDANNYLHFVITNEGQYSVLARVDGSTRVGPAGTSPAIKRNAPNLLQVVASGTKFTFMVNGQTVTQVEVPGSVTQGTFGLVAGGGVRAPAEVAFSDFRLTVG